MVIELNGRDLPTKSSHPMVESNWKALTSFQHLRLRLLERDPGFSSETLLRNCVEM